MNGTSRFSTVAFAIAVLASTNVSADEGGISFWIPGLFGALAAAPQAPGWSEALTYYHTSVSAGAGVARAREITIGGIPANLTANVNANVKSNVDLGLVTTNYVFETPVLGGQAAASVLGIYGSNFTSLTGTINGTLATPFGTIPFFRSDTINSSDAGFGDLAPQFSLRWKSGVHNYMTYITGDIPVGSYSSTRLANIGIGHGAVDAGGGYTYYDQQAGREVSAVLGFTYNLKNQDTQYQSGVDMHLDWAASQFLSKQVLVGLVGYLYKEIGCDSGSGDRVGCFRSQVAGIGPQVAYLFPFGTMQGTLSLKGYAEFAAQNRPQGWNAWATFSISPMPPASAAQSKQLATK